MNITTQEISSTSNIGQLVAENYRLANVFRKYGVDFCCNGNRSIDEAAAKDKFEASKLIADLQEVSEGSQANQDSEIDYGTWPLDLLADYIEKTHHRFVTAKITEITPLLDKIVRVHGGAHPELKEVQTLFMGSAGELSQHMKKEELLLFPYIRRMVDAKVSNQPLPVAGFGSVANPIAAMHADHDAEGERFRKIDSLTNGYQVPEDGCTTYKVTLALIQEFELDLHKHIHLENNILFPKSIELEKRMQEA